MNMLINISVKKDFIVNLALGILLGIGIFILPLIFLVLSTAVGFIEQGIAQVAWVGFLSIVGFLPIIIGLTLLITNRRLALTIAGWVLLILLIGFLILNKESMYSVIFFRNTVYIGLVVYLIAHLVIHSMAWFIKRKRKILTIWGVVNWFVLFNLINYAYALIIRR